MSSTVFSENYYSFRNTVSVIGSISSSPSAEQETLSAIESLLVQANNDFLSNQYQDAIDAYKQAETLIYSQLDPSYPPSVIGDAVLSRDPGLFAPLLSASLEWMNLIPVRQPVVPVRSRVAVNPSLLGGAVQYDQVGIESSQLSSAVAASALADWQLSQVYAKLGNNAASAYFANRARTTSSSTVSLLGSPVTAAPGGAPSKGGLPAAAKRQTTVGPIARVEPSSVLPAFPIGRPPAFTQIVPLPVPVTLSRTLGVNFGGKVTTFSWVAGDAPPIDQVTSTVYAGRVGLASLQNLLNPPASASDVAVNLPHDYYYVIPLGLAECYHALGDYSNAESHYLMAASYQYLNAAIEAPYLWLRLATLYLDWGDAIFKRNDPADALPVYENVIMHDNSVPASKLYTTASLKPGADVARTVIAAIAAGQDVTKLAVNPQIASAVLQVQQEIMKITGGLDFWGNYANNVPIWTFDYLQSVAVNFAQLAVSAERDYISFQDKADTSSLTRQQLVEASAQADAEYNAAWLQYFAARDEASAYQDGADLANQRATDDSSLANEWASNAPIISMDNAIASIQGGTDQDVVNLQQASQDLSSQFQQDSLNAQATEMQIAAVQAGDEATAAQAKTNVAQAGVTVAQLKQQAAAQDLQAFDAQVFTPDVWHRMGQTMLTLYQRYFTMALKVAFMMQQAYNFEFDESVALIKTDYSTVEVQGLLGADALMADIQSFTYDMIFTEKTKPQPIKQTISLAQNYSLAFETKFRSTGIMDFETRIEDFDYYYPGTYAGRIQAIEVEIDGLLPVSGISGTLTNTGISIYRVPASQMVVAAIMPKLPPRSGTPAPTPPSVGGILKYRIQPKETLVLSDYAVRNDALLLPQDSHILEVFQGSGVASSWHLEIPMSVNDLDYNTITDVRLTFYYKARYDPKLHDQVVAYLAAAPGANARQRGMPLRWLYPDAFFGFQDTGSLSITLLGTDFRYNETNPIITCIGLVVTTDGSVPAAGIKVQLGTPAHPAAITGQTDSGGLINSSQPSSPWVPLAAGTALGPYTLAVTAADNPSLVQNGKLDLSPIINVGLIMAYSFTPRS